MYRLLLLALFGTLTFNQVLAQPGWKWPEDETLKEKAEEKNALYTDAKKQGNFRESANHLNWLLVNTPDLNKSLYVNGSQIYDKLATAESDKAKKTVLQDSALMMYDYRIKYFNEESKVLDRKAFYSYKYFKGDKARYADIYQTFKKVFELKGEAVWDANLVAYMDIAGKSYNAKTLVDGSNALTDAEMLDLYNQLGEIIDAKIAKNPKNEEKLNKNKETIDKIFVTYLPVDCDFIETKLGPQFDAKPDDLKMANNIMKLSIAYKCTDSKYFEKSITKLYKNEPTYGMAKVIASILAERKEFDEALKYYEEAAEMADTEEKKGDVYLGAAKVLASSGQKSRARSYAKKAVAASAETKTDAYKLIGLMYYNSFNDCKKGENPVEDRAIYIAAYNAYSVAGDSRGMAKAKEQFPTMTDIFTYGMQVGDSYTIGCWIGETISIQKRDQ